MIDPFNFTNYNRTIPELEQVIIFCALVAGKNASRTSRSLDKFLKAVGWKEGKSPFKLIRFFNLEEVNYPYPKG